MTTTAKSLEAAVTSLGKDTNRLFLIGGAQLYNAALAPRDPDFTSFSDTASTSAGSSTATQATLVDRVLLTRVTSPDFECDTFLTDFASQRRRTPDSTSGEKVWKLCSHRELCDWLGWDAPQVDIEEKGVVYHYEMWVKDVAR